MLVIDKNAIDEAYGNLGNDFILSILNEVSEQYPREWEIITKHYQNNDLVEFEKAVHKMKGTLGVLYPKETVKICQEIMNKAKVFETEGLDLLLKNLEESIEKVDSDITELKASLS